MSPITIQLRALFYFIDDYLVLQVRSAPSLYIDLHLVTRLACRRYLHSAFFLIESAHRPTPFVLSDRASWLLLPGLGIIPLTTWPRCSSVRALATSRRARRSCSASTRCVRMHPLRLPGCSCNSPTAST